MPVSSTDDERSIIATVDRWRLATMSADADTLDGILAPGFTYMHATTAAIDTREQWLESFRTGGRSYHIYAVEELTFRHYPDLVAVTGRSHQEMGPEAERRELNARFTCLWSRQDSGWRLEYWQATRIPPPTP